MKKTIALEFATNLSGNISPEIKARLQAVINNPCEATWEDTYSLIINGSGKSMTLWQAVLIVRPDFTQSKSSGSLWKVIPSSADIVSAINEAVFRGGLKEKQISKEILTSFYTRRIF